MADENVVQFNPTQLLPREIECVEYYLANQRQGKVGAWKRIMDPNEKVAKRVETRAYKFFKRAAVKQYMDLRRDQVIAATGVNYEYLVQKQRKILEECMEKATWNPTGANRAIETLGKLTGAFEADNRQKGEAAGDIFDKLLSSMANAGHKPGNF